MYAEKIAAAKAHYGNTDKYFALPAGSFSFQDEWLAKELELLTEAQLKDTGVWKLFVDLFRNPGVDDADNGWRCEYWGKMMRGACFTYQVTGDEELYAVLRDTVEDMLTTQDSMGRFSTYTPEAEFHGWDLWGRKYILLGMEYFLEICKDEDLQDRIVTALMAHADYIISKFGPEEEGKLNIAKATSHWDGLNSCSIMEPYMFLYNITGQQRYLDFAEYILSFGGTATVNLFEKAYEDDTPVYNYHVRKAYEMISCFEGLAEYNKVKPSEKHTQALIRFTDRVMAEEQAIIGCLGCEHEIFNHAALVQCDESLRGIMLETCVTVTWMKFLWQIFRLTGDGKYMDAFEIAAYNAMSAALKREIHPEDNGGIPLPIHSYNPMIWNHRFPKNIGGYKTISDKSHYGCCVCIATAGYALEGISAVCVDKDDNIAINMYRNGTVRTPKCTLTAETTYPTKGAVRYTLTNTAGKFAVSLRIPAWSIHTSLYVNNEIVDAEAGTYVTIDREWKDGDTITLSLEMTLRMIHPQDFVKESEVTNRIAIMRGPVVFAIDGTGEEEPTFAPVELRELMASGLSSTAPVPCHLTIDVPHVDGRIAELVDYSSAAQLAGHKLSCWMKID